jgi:hypothetical protein
MKTGAGASLLFISPLGEHMRYAMRLRFPASNNMAEYEALLCGLKIAIETGIKRLDVRGDSQLVIDYGHEECELSRRQDGGILQGCASPRGQVLRHRTQPRASPVQRGGGRARQNRTGRITVPPNVFARASPNRSSTSSHAHQAAKNPRGLP